MQNDPTPPPARVWQPNRLVRVGVRVFRTYIQAVLGFLAVTTVGNVGPGSSIPPPADAGQALMVSFYAGLFPALLALLLNLLEELNHIEPGTSTRG